MEPELRAFMTRWGNLFKTELKAQLMMSYKFAPGYNGDAYSNGRNPEYQGQAPKSATNSLYDSITGQMTEDGFELLMLDYWEYVNYGREKGKYVPITPLQEWATLKGIPNPESAAFGISRNIFKFGIAPTNFYENAIDRLQEQFDAQLEENVSRSFTEFFDNLLERTIPST
jgi:hypothetical protein